jgi:hypothetical protein
MLKSNGGALPKVYWGQSLLELIILLVQWLSKGMLQAGMTGSVIAKAVTEFGKIFLC